MQVLDILQQTHWILLPSLSLHLFLQIAPNTITNTKEQFLINNLQELIPRSHLFLCLGHKLQRNGHLQLWIVDSLLGNLIECLRRDSHMGRQPSKQQGTLFAFLKNI